MSKKEKVLSADELALQKLNSNSNVSDEEYLNSLNSNISSQKLSDTGVVQKEFAARQKFDAQMNATMDGIPELNKEEKDYLLKAGKSGQLSPEEFKTAIDVMRGKSAKQQQMVDENGKIINITPVGQVDQSKGFIEQLNEGVQNMFGASGKALGQGHYYMKDNGKGMLVPVPLAVGERPEAGYTVDSVWGNQAQAEDDTRGTDVAKKIFNVVPAIAQGILALPELAQGLITGKTDTGFRVGQQELESLKFKTASEYDKSVVDISKVKEFKDLFNAEIYDLSPSTAVNQMVNAGTSILQLLATRGALGFTGTTGKIATAGNYLAGFTTNLAEPLKAADAAGVDGRAKYAVASIYSTLATAVEMKLGIEGKILKQEGTAIKREMIKKLIKDNVNVVDGKLTKESVDNLFKETLKELPKFYKTFAKNALEEGTEEVVQNMIQNGSQEIHDILMKDDPEGAKYNTKFWSPESLAGYMNSFASGMIGGVGGSAFVKNKQSETAYTAVAEGKDSELKADLASSLKRGKITQDEYDRAVFKVNSYKEYFEATKDRPIDDVNKRKIFDLTYEKQNLKSSIESLEKNNPSGINDGLINTKKQQLTDLNNQVNDIWTKAEATNNPVTSAKQQVPAWKTSVDKFAKEVSNPDKTVSQDFTTREQIETAVGVTPELNQLAKPFKVEFKTPSLPEEAGGIKIENGFLSEPYMTEKTETSEPTLKTRELPVYAMEDKDGGTWLFAAGEKTDNDIPDTSYLIKVGEDGKYEGHQEFHYEAPKKNTLTFDDIPSAFDRLGLSPVGTAKAVNEFKSEDEKLFAEVYDDVVAGNDRGKMTTFPGVTLGVIVNGKPIKFASSYHTNAFINRENIPDGDVEIGIRAVENVPTKNGPMKGLMAYNLETGADIGYLRATDKSSGVKPSGVESDMTDVAKKKLEAIEADQKNYEIQETALGPKYINKNTGEAYDRVSSFVGGKFTGKDKLKGKAFGVGKLIEGIVTDFFQGNVKDYSEYNKNMSKADYDDVISQLNEVKNFAKRRGFSIVTKPLVIADDRNKIAGVPNLLMIDKKGGLYVYDISTLRNPEGNPIRQQMQKVWKGAPMTTEERVSAQVNIYADILEGKYGQDVKGVGVIPFNVNYNTKGEDLKIDSVKKSKRIDYDRKQVLNNSAPVFTAPTFVEKKSRYDNGKRASEMAIEEGFDFNIPEEATRFIAERSENPAEIAEEYLTLEAKKSNTKDYKFQALDEANITLTEDNFNKVVDPNKMSPAIKKKFIRKTATPLDDQLMSISEDAGVTITEKDFENYIDNFESPKNPSISLKRALAQRYYEITGKQLTRAVARNIVEEVKGVDAKNQQAIENVEGFEQNAVKSEFEAQQMTDEEIAALEQSQKNAEANDIAKAMQSENIIPPMKDIVRGNDNDEMAFQKKKAEKIAANIETIVATLKKAMPNVNVVYDDKLDAAGSWNRATKTITINPYYAGTDTPIHEYGHVLIDAMGDNRVVKAAIKQLMGTELWNKTKEAYPELTEEQLGYEVLAEAIGIEGAGIFDDQAAKSKFKQYLEYIYDWFKTQLGLNKNVAKSLAKKIIGGIGTKKMDGVGVGTELQKTKKARKLDADSYYRIAFGDKNSITIDDLKGAIATYEDMVAKDPSDKTAARKLEASQKRLEEFEKAYKKYSYDYNKLNRIKEEQGVLDGKSFDELSELYNTISEFDPLADNAYLASVKYRIAYLMAEEQRKFLESKGNSIKPRAFADIKNKDVYMKALGHMTEAFPEMQYLSKAYDAAVQAMNEERREKQNKITELAKAVAKEEAKTLGLKMKDFFSGKAYEFFKWMDKGGELISTSEAYNLSKAKGDYVKYYREIREDYKDVQQETPAGFDENSLLMTDKNFAEQMSSNGIVSAIQSWLGTSSGMKQVVMNYTHSDKRSELLTLEEIEQALQKEAEKGLISKAIASAKSVYYNTKAKKLLNKGTDEEGNDISHLKSQADYIVDRKGKLVNKFGVKRKEGYDYSKDFHAAMVQYLNDITWTKHMQPIIPLVESVEQFAKSTGASKGSAKNLEAWIGNWKKMHIYKDKPMTKFPEVEALLKFLRKMTSLTSLAFNVKASIMNISIAEYNNWKELGGTKMAIGHKRLVANTKLGKKKISTKAHNILMKYGVVATDYDETSTLKAVGSFNQLAMGMTKFAEYIAQGSMFLGQMTKEEWAAFDNEGNYIGKDPDFKQKIEQYKTKVSNTHGKYSAKDRRNFELYELGKFVGQFKTWVPDWWKERFGSEYIDQYGNRQKGTYTDFLSYAVKDLRKDIMKPEFWTSDKLEYVNARKNLKAAMVFGILLAIRAGNDEDKKKRQKADFLSQAIGNLTFIFDPEQAKYMLKTPFAGMSYANNMLNLMTDLSPKNAKKVVPYAKVVDVQDMFGD